MTARRWISTLVTVATICTGGPFAASAAAAPTSAAAADEQDASAASDSAGRYLVRYETGTDVSAAARSLRSRGVDVRRSFGHAVRGASITATPAQAAALARSPDVQTVEVDAVIQVTESQSDAPWGLDRIDQRTLPLSTTFTGPASGAGVDVYVVDTGVLASHADFGSRVAAGWTAINDGRGSSDCNGHGTHVAGTVAGATHGVAKAATVIPVRVLSCDGSGYMSDVVAGLDWAVSRHTAGTPAVVNLSLGGAASSTLDAAVDGAISDGIIAAVAAGNSSVDACTVSPARVPAALTVAASDSTDRQATFSNHGSCVDMYAPGVAIASAWHTSPTATEQLSGTSMAAPHVAGAAAVIFSQNPSLTPAQVTTLLATEATTGALTATTSGTANRLLFIGQPAEPVVNEPVATAPDRATDLKAAPRKRAAKLTWVQGTDGGSPLTGQRINVYKGKKKVRTIAISANATTRRILRLKPGGSYAFRVIATNNVGSSPTSARSNTVVPRR